MKCKKKRKHETINVKLKVYIHLMRKCINKEKNKEEQRERNSQGFPW